MRKYKIGRELGLKYPNALRKFLSDKLWEEYNIDNQHYRDEFWDAVNQSGAFFAVINQFYNRLKGN